MLDIHLTNYHCAEKGTVPVQVGDFVEVLYESGNTYSGVIHSLDKFADLALSMTLFLGEDDFRTLKSRKILTLEVLTTQTK